MGGLYLPARNLDPYSSLSPLVGKSSGPTVLMKDGRVQKSHKYHPSGSLALGLAQYLPSLLYSSSQRPSGEDSIVGDEDPLFFSSERFGNSPTTLEG